MDSNNQQQNFHLLVLPAELKLRILKLPSPVLDEKSKAALAQTCKTFYQVYHDHKRQILKADMQFRIVELQSTVRQAMVELRKRTQDVLALSGATQQNGG